MLPARERRLVFYAEDGGSWVHFAPIVDALAPALDQPIPYLTSSAEDPVLAGDDPRLKPFFVGEGAVRTWLFSALRADVAVMTMPDLETFHLKRSRAHPVHYAYVFHSMVSTHMIYRDAAFDHFDSVLCVGPHHQREIRSRERVARLKAKRLVRHGYGRLDSILSHAATAPAEVRPPGAPLRVVVAPSWGPDGLLERHGTLVVDALARDDVALTVRPHPMTVRRHPEQIAALRERLNAIPGARLDLDMASEASLHDADVMVSDWSGAALEYAFGRERPVVFVDVPRKVNNPDYERLAVEPLEVGVRGALGAVLPPKDLHYLPIVLAEVAAGAEACRTRIRQVRDDTVYNVGHSGEAAAAHLMTLLEERGHDA
jgi:YidC/Oxa1 family membrane protein insertase